MNLGRLPFAATLLQHHRIIIMIECKSFTFIRAALSFSISPLVLVCAPGTREGEQAESRERKVKTASSKTWLEVGQGKPGKKTWRKKMCKKCFQVGACQQWMLLLMLVAAGRGAAAQKRGGVDGTTKKCKNSIHS